jgi:sigma-54 specific flagellar transcriptional regulator A
MSHDAPPEPAQPRRAAAQESLRKLMEQADQHEVFGAALDRSRDAVFVVDPDRNILLFNRGAEHITGFSRDEVEGHHCLAGFRCTTCLEACRIFERGQVDRVPLDLFRKDGSVVRVEKSASVLRDADGEVLGAVEVFHRIDDAEDDDAPRFSEAEKARVWGGIDLLMSTLGRGALLLDAEFRIRRTSGAFADLVGVGMPHLIGTPVAEYLGDGLFSEASQFQVGLASGERREGWRATVSRPDGGVHPVSVSGAPFDGGDFCGDQGSQTPRYLLVVRPETPVDAVSGYAVDPQASIRFEGMVARSQRMRQVFHLIEHLQAVDAAVLITGESGTGKELVARAIHARSARANRPFVGVNCGALPADLLEAELFGHARGAFTGAVRDRAGRCEVAEDGTLFLDEIGDMPVPLQVKLLRVLQERSFERVGENDSRPFRARVVAATHQDLTRAVAEKRFREDLFYRLNVVPIELPPLRHRREDLDVLIAHLLDKIGQRRSRALRLSPGAMRALLSFDWPGNVRQLENALEYATAVCDGQTIHVEDLPPETRLEGAHSPLPGAPPAPPDSGGHQRVLPSAHPYPTSDAILQALHAARHRRAHAARMLGVSRTTLWRRMKELGLS